MIKGGERVGRLAENSRASRRQDANLHPAESPQKYGDDNGPIKVRRRQADMSLLENSDGLYILWLRLGVAPTYCGI